MAEAIRGIRVWPCLNQDDIREAVHNHVRLDSRTSDDLVTCDGSRTYGVTECRDITEGPPSHNGGAVT